MTEFFVTLYNVICNALTLGTDTASKNVFSYVDACMTVLTLRVQATREEFSLPTPLLEHYFLRGLLHRASAVLSIPL